jgi:hypothetical protein
MNLKEIGWQAEGCLRTGTDFCAHNNEQFGSLNGGTEESHKVLRIICDPGRIRGGRQ